jgi:hypothetical protein
MEGSAWVYSALVYTGPLGPSKHRLRDEAVDAGQLRHFFVSAD